MNEMERDIRLEKIGIEISKQKEIRKSNMKATGPFTKKLFSVAAGGEKKLETRPRS